MTYQIYPRSFQDSNGDGIGDLPGIISRLDYLVDLGVDAIWLSPVFASPMADFGYDISDHCDVDPMFGTLNDLDQLIAEAHHRGLRVLLDIVLGHTSDRHPWFLDAATSRTARYRNFYVWRDGPTLGSPDGGPPNNWTAGFPADTSAWTWHDHTGQWYLHSHLPQQPDLDWTNPVVRDAQAGVLRFWLDRGVDGLRLDSINRLGKDPQLRDNIPGQPLRQQNWPSVHHHLRYVRSIIDDYPHAVTVGEVWLFDQRELVPYLVGDGLHLVHNFAFARAPFDATSLRATVDEFDRLVPHAWPSWFFNNHDEPRTASRWRLPGEPADHGIARARAGAVLVLALRGTPYLYQGEELALPDTDLPADAVVDANGRDPQRTPMPWAPPTAAGPGAGFTTGTPWLPIGDAADHLNVATQRHDPTSTLSLYRQLLRLRRTRPSLQEGEQVVLDLGDDKLLGILRTLPEERTLIMINTATSSRDIDLTVLAPTGASPLLSTRNGRARERHAAQTLTIEPLEAIVLAVDGS
ncbi:alpha-amylase family glycosyl hydrolase [Kribbella sp. NPDC004138]